jgi:hypothetical protein
MELAEIVDLGLLPISAYRYGDRDPILEANRIQGVLYVRNSKVAGGHLGPGGPSYLQEVKEVEGIQREVHTVELDPNLYASLLCV